VLADCGACTASGLSVLWLAPRGDLHAVICSACTAQQLLPHSTWTGCTASALVLTRQWLGSLTDACIFLLLCCTFRAINFCSDARRWECTAGLLLHMLVVELTAECRCIVHSFLFWSHTRLASAVPDPEAHSQLAPFVWWSAWCWAGGSASASKQQHSVTCACAMTHGHCMASLSSAGIE
jgi:hypothetical protein